MTNINENAHNCNNICLGGGKKKQRSIVCTNVGLQFNKMTGRARYTKGSRSLIYATDKALANKLISTVIYARDER